MRSRKLFGLAAGLLAALLSSALRGQAPAPPVAPTTMFPFVIPWDDATAGTATDMSFLSPGEAGVDGYVVARGGHFVTTKKGERIRFLGTNFTFASDFPTHADAEKVAAHLRKMGINIVRIHHHDFNSGMLWDKRFPDHRHIDAGARDRLDYLIYQLKRNGVYVDLNLHVSRQFTAADGFPESVDQLKDYDKRVDYFDPKMIALQKEFARDYLTHVNPYTKRSYCDDPCVALIEINNENSLVSDAGSRLAGELVDLPEPFRGELVGQWNDWLAARYKTDAALTAAWSAGATAVGPNLLADAARKWTIEHQGTSAATLTPDPAVDGAPGATIDVQTIDSTDWHVQAHFTGLNLAEGATYTVAFQARVPQGAPARSLVVNTGLDQPDWHHVGLDTRVSVGSEWKSYRAFFTAQNVVADHCRLTFGLGNQVGVVQLRGVSIQAGVPPSAAAGGAAPSLAARTIALPESATAAERADWIGFLEDTERKYADGMRGFLKNDLKTHANICCSQIMWGESAGFYREANMDFADGHAYWGHPSFPHKAWDMSDWTIGNRPMVTDLASGGGGTLRRLAEYRVAGKPYTVTEYNEPAPNDYQCETVPELAAFAAEQDWDAIFLFDYGDYGANAANDRIQSFFGIGSNPAKMAFMPAAALIFRAGYVMVDSDVSHYGGSNPPEATLTLAEMRSALPMEQILQLRKQHGHSDRSPAGMYDGQLNPHPINFDPSTKAMIVFGNPKSDGDGTGIGIGFLGQQAQDGLRSGGSSKDRGYDLGYSDVTIHPFGNGFCAITITPLLKFRGGSAITGNCSYLITVVGRAENVGMGWTPTRDSVGTNWGSGPTQAEFVPATVTLPARANAHVWALDGTGKRTKEIAAKHGADGTLTFETSAEAKTVWYEVGAP